jgi:fructose-1,6-bisphosphatase/inositol monophosphatase family enzyme
VASDPVHAPDGRDESLRTAPSVEEGARPLEDETMRGDPAYRTAVRGALETAHETFVATSDEDRRVVEDTAADFTTAVDRRLGERIRAFFDAQPTEFCLLSEEGPTAPSSRSAPIVIVDEVDGTANLAKGNGDLPFGTVVAVADAVDPTFDDVAAMGYLVLSTGDLYEAYRGQGASLTRRWAGRSDATDDPARSRLESSGRSRVDGTADQAPPSVLVDQYMLAGRPELARTLWTLGYPGDYRSLCHHLALVARGDYDIAVSGDHCVLHEEKRATAEELAGAYRLVIESGGAVMDWEGVPLCDVRIGFADGETHDVVAAATESLARETARHL